MKIVITDSGFPNVDAERIIIESSGHEMQLLDCKSAQDVIDQANDADALIVQWAPIDADVIDALSNCKVIVRYGIGVDNVDLDTAAAAGILVCNIPDYCINEVADHSMAMALALHRQLPQTQKRLLGGEWSIMPPEPLHASDEKIFATIGFGRIAKAVLQRAKAFGFRCVAVDPVIPAEFMEKEGVEWMEMEDALTSADIISLHCPLNEDTKHLIGGENIFKMKRGAIVINTSRGGLIDLDALNTALKDGKIGGAGLDVYDPEPADTSHDIFQRSNLIATSHTAWNSTASIPKLQALAAEEAVRVIEGGAAKNRVN